MAEMPIVDLSTRQIDWSQPQPFGTWRCDRGWETDGHQCGCLERATTDVQCEDIDTGRVITEHLCTPHALIAQLMSINTTLERQTGAVAAQTDAHEDMTQTLERAIDELSGNVWSINRRMMPWPYRAYSYSAYWCGRINNWRRERKLARDAARLSRARRHAAAVRAAASHAAASHAAAMRVHAVLNPEVIDFTDPTHAGEEVTGPITAPHIGSLVTPADYRAFLETGRLAPPKPSEAGEEVIGFDNNRGDHGMDAPGGHGPL